MSLAQSGLTVIGVLPAAIPGPLLTKLRAPIRKGPQACVRRYTLLSQRSSLHGAPDGPDSHGDLFKHTSQWWLCFPSPPPVHTHMHTRPDTDVKA